MFYDHLSAHSPSVLGGLSVLVHQTTTQATRLHTEQHDSASSLVKAIKKFQDMTSEQQIKVLFIDNRSVCFKILCVAKYQQWT